MKIFWAGQSAPPTGLEFAGVRSLESIKEHALVFIDDVRLIHTQIDPLARIYLVSNEEIDPRDLPVEIMGIIPNDVRVLKTIAGLYNEMRDLFNIGDRLIDSLLEKDQTIQAKQNALLRESKRHMAIIKNASDLIFLVGPKGRITLCNDTMNNYLSPDKSLLGISFADFVLQEDQAALGQLIDSGFQKAQAGRMDIRLYLADGRIGIFSLMATPLLEDARVFALSFIGRDVTVIRSMQQRLSVQAQDFASMTRGLSHELRNPLTVIGAYLAKLAKESQVKDFKERYAAMVASIQRIEHMVARIERYEAITTQECTFTLVDLGALVKDTIMDLNLSRQIRIKIWQPVWAYSDAGHIRIALSRLLENSLENGSIEGEVHISQHDGYAYIVVRDFGHGIAVDPKELFAPFYSTDPMKVGLGLTEARLAMVKVGGKIEVIPQAEPGAIFMLQLFQDRRRIPRMLGVHGTHSAMDEDEKK